MARCRRSESCSRRSAFPDVSLSGPVATRTRSALAPRDFLTFAVKLRSSEDTLLFGQPQVAFPTFRSHVADYRARRGGGPVSGQSAPEQAGCSCARGVVPASAARCDPAPDAPRARRCSAQPSIRGRSCACPSNALRPTVPHASERSGSGVRGCQDAGGQKLGDDNILDAMRRGASHDQRRTESATPASG